MHFSDRGHHWIPLWPPPLAASTNRLVKVACGFLAAICCRVCRAKIRLSQSRALFSLFGDIILAPNPGSNHSDRGSFVGTLVCCIRRGGRLSQIFIRSDRALAPAATSSHHHKFRGLCAHSFHIGNCRHDGECLCERHLFWRRLLDNSPSFNLRCIPLPYRLSHIHEPLTVILGSRSINTAHYRQAIGWFGYGD